MAAPADVWACPSCSYSENIDGTTCQMCSSARPGGRRSVLLVDRSSNHPAAVAAAARGSRGRGPPKARVAALARESPTRGAKEKANERIAAQLAQRAAVPVAEVVHSPSSPDSPLIPPVAATGSTGAIRRSPERVRAHVANLDRHFHVVARGGREIDIGRDDDGLDAGDDAGFGPPTNSRRVLKPSTRSDSGRAGEGGTDKWETAINGAFIHRIKCPRRMLAD